MSVRKRSWLNPAGEKKEAWVIDYVDQNGRRHLKTFARKRDADAHHAVIAVNVRAGIHTADSRSPTVANAGKLWFKSGENAGFERSTMHAYRSHLTHHIVPLIGAVKLSALTVPLVREFEDQLRASRSPAMVRKVMTTLGTLLADAQERGLVAQNVVRSLRKSRHHSRDRQSDKRQKGKLKIGVDVPTLDEIRAIIPHLKDRWRPVLLTAIFTGLRASELRGLRWADIDLKQGELHVRQRADHWNAIGRPKSEAGERTIPLAPILVNTLREWKLACPKSDLDLAFPNRMGRVWARQTIAGADVNNGLWPAQIAAGVVNEAGKAKYPGLHSLRHFYASWCINRRADGGLELPLKVVQGLLGHASIQMTADVYGHLFPRGDDGTELATAAEKLFLA